MDNRVVGDAVLVRAVAQHAGVDPHDVVVLRVCPACGSVDHGRPVVRWTVPGPPVPSVSLARAGDLTLVAVTDAGPVGVDVEAVARFPRPGFAAFALHPTEPVPLTPGSSPRPSAVGEATTWVRKEGLLKATGDGLRIDPRQVRLGPADRPAELVGWPGPAPQVWWHDASREGYAAAVAVVAGRGPRSWPATGGAPEVTLRWERTPTPGPPGPPGRAGPAGRAGRAGPSRRATS